MTTVLLFFILLHRVVLRKNGNTVVSSISQEGGYNPVFQSTLLPLESGDVVQLEARIKVRI